MVNQRLRREAYLAVKEILMNALADNYTYPKMEAELGINRYYLWHIINTKEYKPPNWVLHRLGLRVSRDLYAMPVAELRWALENREEMR